MVIQELVARAIEIVAGLVGAHGIEAGLLASAVVIIWHGHRLLAFLQTAIRTFRIGLISAMLVGLAVVMGLTMGWVSIDSIPSIGGLIPLMVAL